MPNRLTILLEDVKAPKLSGSAEQLIDLNISKVKSLYKASNATILPVLLRQLDQSCRQYRDQRVKFDFRHWQQAEPIDRSTP
jgi:hypothetical protein